MKQKDIDIYEILEDVSEGSKLYTPMCGVVELRSLQDDKEAPEAIITLDKNSAEYTFNKNGKYVKEGEVLLFPSNEMRDWSKFFKKGDILVHKDGNVHIIFEGFEDETYRTFHGKNYLWENEGSAKNFEENETYMQTSEFDKANKEDAQEYIHKIEKRLGGKLNLETMKVEKPKKPVFEIGKLYVFHERDEDGELTIIGKLISKNESEDTLRFGYQYEIETEKFVTDQAFDLRISVNTELREATEGEAITFQEACTQWEKQKKAKEHPVFKPFDKVLVRCDKKYKWLPAFFVRDRGDEYAWRYKVLCIHSGKVADFAYCIPFEGHENIACTNYDIENLPFWRAYGE